MTTRTDPMPDRDHAMPAPQTRRARGHIFPRTITFLAIAFFIPITTPGFLHAEPGVKPSSASTKPPRRIDRRPFGRGVVDLGGAAAFGGSGDGGFAFTFGGNAGYFVLNGLEPGVQTDVTVGNNIDTQWTVLPFLRWIPFSSRSFSPYLKATAGGLFVFGSGDTLKLGLYGGGGGVVLGLGGRMALNLEGLALRIAPKDRCPGGDCMLYRFGISISVLFGQPPPKKRRRRRRGPLFTPSPSPAEKHSPPGNGRKPHPPVSPSTPPEAPTPPLAPGPDEIPTPTPDEPGLG